MSESEGYTGHLSDKRTPVFGKVAHFDEERGIGRIVSDSGSEIVFHCTAIADGSRRIPEGARVAFVTRPGHLGLLEAAGVTIVTLSAGSATVPG
jgi:cold shock CspA family protein